MLRLAAALLLIASTAAAQNYRQPWQSQPLQQVQAPQTKQEKRQERIARRTMETDETTRSMCMAGD